jgi:hypothetical protein
MLETKSAGRENRDYMASTKQTIKLYWVTTQDHDEDWFIFAESARSARAYHEHMKVTVKAMLDPV